MKRFCLMLLAMVGLPLVWVFGHCLLKTWAVDFVDVPFWTLNRICFGLGVLTMSALYLLCGQRIIVLYVFAHEMTHALAGLCFLAKIHQISIRATGGFVRLSKGNLIITLAPYCVPFYLLVLALLYVLLQCFVPDVLPFWVWSFLFGVATLFHICFTFDALFSVSQPDTHEYGRFFSWWFILVTNLFFALLTVTFTSPHYTLRHQAVQVAETTYRIYAKLYQTSAHTVSHIRQTFFTTSKPTP